MSLKHIMLGMLHEPHSGYDLKKRFDKSLRSFWRAELSQIYPTLQKMEQDGLLSSQSSESEIGPTRRIYKRSTKGRDALKTWLQDGPTLGTEKIAYLAQVFFLANLKDDDAAIAFMQELRQYMSEWLQQLEAAEAGWRADDPRYPDDLPDEDFYPQLTLDLGLAKVRANVEWCDRSIERIEKRKRRAVHGR